jgi:hypothetical protein
MFAIVKTIGTNGKWDGGTADIPCNHVAPGTDDDHKPVVALFSSHSDYLDFRYSDVIEYDRVVGFRD